MSIGFNEKTRNRKKYRGKERYFIKSEHDIQNTIRLRLSERGFCVFRANVGKVRISDGRYFDTGLPKGFTDLFAVKNGRIYFLEVKSETGKARPEQEHFIAVMRDKYGCVAGVVRSAEDAIRLCDN